VRDIQYERMQIKRGLYIMHHIMNIISPIIRKMERRMRGEGDIYIYIYIYSI